MKLVYVYMKTFECFHERGFNFSNNYRIETEKNEEQYHLTINGKDNLNRFIYGQRMNLQAIIGDNGTGKSTIFDCIRMMIFNQEEFGNKYEAFSVWEDEGKLTIFNMTRNQISGFSDEVECKKISLDSDNTALIYYSDLFDEKYYNNDFDDGLDQITYPDRSIRQLNISTSHYLALYKKQSLQHYFYDEVKRQIELVQLLLEKNFQPIDLGFIIPNTYKIRLEPLNANICERFFKGKLSEYTTDVHQISNGSLEETATITVLKILDKYSKYLKRYLRNNNDVLSYINQVFVLNTTICCIYNMLENVWGNDILDDFSYTGEIDYFELCRAIISSAARKGYEQYEDFINKIELSNLNAQWQIVVEEFCEIIVQNYNINNLVNFYKEYSKVADVDWLQFA